MKKTTSLLLAAAMLVSLTACDFQDAQPPDDGVSQVTGEAGSSEQSTDAQPSAEEAPEDDSAVTEEPVQLPRNLYEITVGDLRSYRSSLKELDRSVPNKNVGSFTEDMFLIVDSSAVSLQKTWVDVRESSRIMRDAEADESDIIALVDSNGYKRDDLFDTAYVIDWDDPLLQFSHDYSEGLREEYCKVGYILYRERLEPITTRGFVRYTGSGDDIGMEFILDPAYTYGIPMLSSLPENIRFDINGREVYADTLAFDCELYNTEYPLPEDGSYVYAEVSFTEMHVIYGYSDNDAFRGYDNRIYIDSVEVLTENTDSVIEGGFLFSDSEKAPEMTATYNALINNLDTIYNDDTTIGMTFADMDFDGVPELLVSDSHRGEIENSVMGHGADVSVYRIEGEQLRKVGIIPNAVYRGGVKANTIGVKHLPDGSKGWFVSTYKDMTTGEYGNDCDYLCTLQGDSLMFEELFSTAPNPDAGDVNSDDYTPFIYYALGEPMDITVTPNEPPEDLDSMWYENTYTWGEYSTVLGMGVLYDIVRSDYANDITETYNLRCDWLSNANLVPVTITERELSYNLANMVDCFYLGIYNPLYQNYYYDFVGAIAKPVIYLYPEETTEVSVSVEFMDGGGITVSYPDYGDGWNVTAHPDGTLFDEDGSEYYCLYWEGEGRAAVDLSRGFCVRGEDTAQFLREKLLHIGLTPREANEFIIYWLPLMQDNEYNIIALHTEQYSESIPLTVSPKPDTEIRVFMTYTPSDTYVEILPQALPSYERSGFTLVEWGGGSY